LIRKPGLVLARADGSARLARVRRAEVRTFADDLASKDSLSRAAAFFRQHLQN
jgi:hypothetical protein